MKNEFIRSGQRTYGGLRTEGKTKRSAPDEPLITVITVVFNGVETVGHTIQSVMSQSYRNIEYIVVDGGSTDGTLEIIEKHSDSIDYWVTGKDAGIYDAMNKGIGLTTGDVIGFLNADDRYASPLALSRVVEQMRVHKLDALMGDVGFFHAANPERIVRRYNSERFSPAGLAWGWMPAHPALFLSRAVVQRVGHFKTDYRIAGDFEFIVRVFHGQPLRYRHLPEILVHMQTGGASTAGWRAKVSLNQEVLRACRENGIKTNVFKVLSKYPYKILEFVFK